MPSTLFTYLLCLSTTISHCRNICLPCTRATTWQHVFTCFHTQAMSQGHQVAAWAGLCLLSSTTTMWHAWACLSAYLFCVSATRGGPGHTVLYSCCVPEPTWYIGLPVCVPTVSHISTCQSGGHLTSPVLALMYDGLSNPVHNRAMSQSHIVTV